MPDMEVRMRVEGFFAASIICIEKRQMPNVGRPTYRLELSDKMGFTYVGHTLLIEKFIKQVRAMGHGVPCIVCDDDFEKWMEHLIITKQHFAFERKYHESKSENISYEQVLVL